EPDTAAINCCRDTGRATIEATDSTGNPSASASSTDTDDGPDGEMSARTDDAPAACSDTPCHENGTRTPFWLSWSASLATITACRAASSTAGCTPKPAGDTPASSGRDTSAKISSPRRHIAVKPWKAGPYPYPRAANRSYSPSTSTDVAPTGGQVDMSAPASAAPGRTTPSACRVQPACASPREYIDTARLPDSSAPPTTTCIDTDPVAGITNGAANISSSTTVQPTSSPARIASSTKPEPGKMTTPPTAWSASQPRAAEESRPVSNTPPELGSSTTAPSSACSLAAKPRPAASTVVSSADSQKRRRSKAYVGSSTNDAPGRVARQSTPTPDTKAWATPVIKLFGSGRSLRNNGTDTTSASASDSSIEEVRPPPGPTSMNRGAPAAFACRMLSANRTDARMWRVQ